MTQHSIKILKFIIKNKTISNANILYDMYIKKHKKYSKEDWQATLDELYKHGDIALDDMYMCIKIKSQAYTTIKENKEDIENKIANDIKGIMELKM